MQTAYQWPQAAGSDGEENDHSFVPSFLRLFLKPQVTQAWNLSIVITVEYGCVRVAHVKRAINRLDIWCAQQKPPYYAGWLKGGVDFLKKMRTRHLPGRNIPSEFSDCTFLAFKLLLKIKKKWLVNSNVGELVQHVLVSVITRFWPNLHQTVENTLFRWRFYFKKIIIWNRIVDTNNYGWFDRVMLRDGTSHNHDTCSFYSFSTRCKQMPGILAYLLV